MPLAGLPGSWLGLATNSMSGHWQRDDVLSFLNLYKFLEKKHNMLKPHFPRSNLQYVFNYSQAIPTAYGTRRRTSQPMQVSFSMLPAGRAITTQNPSKGQSSSWKGFNWLYCNVDVYMYICVRTWSEQ